MVVLLLVVAEAESAPSSDRGARGDRSPRPKRAAVVRKRLLPRVAARYLDADLAAKLSAIDAIQTSTIE